MTKNILEDNTPMNENFSTNIIRRHRVGKVWRTIFVASTAVGIIALVVLLLNIMNSSFGYIAVENEIDP
nr:phosphate ABC transporter permease [Gammaproteobacteria bacterium]